MNPAIGNTDNIYSLVGRTLVAEAATPIYSDADLDSEVKGVIQKGQILGEVAAIIEPAWYVLIDKVWWLKIYTNQPNKFWYVPYLVDYFPQTMPIAEPENTTSMVTPLLVSAVLFAGFKSFTANSRKEKNLWGIGAAVAAGTLIVKGIGSIDLNPFD